jgi:hypothetical protein
VPQLKPEEGLEAWTRYYAEGLTEKELAKEYEVPLAEIYALLRRDLYPELRRPSRVAIEAKKAYHKRDAIAHQ